MADLHGITIHFVYSGNPLNDKAYRAPESITNRLYRYLEKRTTVTFYDVRDTTTIPRVGSDDVVLAHPWPNESSVVHRLMAEPCRAKILIWPFHHGLPEYNRYVLRFEPEADLLLMISGPYWVDTIDGTEFSHFKRKIIRLDNPVDSQLFRLEKKQFNPPGQRGMFVMARSGPEKGVCQLFTLLCKCATGRMLIAGNYDRKDLEIIRMRPEIEILGYIDWTDRKIREYILRYCDFYVNMPVSDASPTTMLESMALGLIPVTTPQGGYFGPSILPLSLTDHEHNMLMISGLQKMTDSHLMELQRQNRTIIESFHSWDRFCSTIVESIESVVRQERVCTIQTPTPHTIVIDGVIFQLQPTGTGGISRIWRHIIGKLATCLPGIRIVLLVRKGFNPCIENIETVEIPSYRFSSLGDLERDDRLLADACMDHHAILFMSTYYTRAPEFYSLQMVYDMIPEILGANMDFGLWASKKRAFSTANSFISISQSTRRDLQRFYGINPPDKVPIAYPGISNAFFPQVQERISDFRIKYGIDKPYFLMVGKRASYKNGAVVLTAFKSSCLCDSVILVMVGGEAFTPTERENYETCVRFLPELNDEELACAYSGALALVYPSLYEGFGLPIIEAHACDCPVVTCKNSSLPEAAGEAALFVRPDSVDDIQKALIRIYSDSTLRQELIAKGRLNAQQFSWDAMIKSIACVIKKLLANPAGIINSCLLKRDQARTISRKAMSALENGEKHEAIRLLTHAVQICPDDPVLHIHFANAIHDADPVASFRSCERALELGGLNKEIVHLCYEHFSKAGQLNSAILSLHRYLDFYPDDKETTSLLTLAYERWCREMYERSIKMKSATFSQEICVSALVSTYASEEFIRECLVDLVNQSIADKMEIVVVDAASPEREKDIVAEFMKSYPNINYIRTPERIGIYAAWNLGAYVARGRYLTPFSTNDRLNPVAYETMSRCLDKEPEVALVYGDTYLTTIPHQSFFDHTPSPLYGGAFRWPAYSYEDLLFNCRIGPHPMWRKSLHADIGYFDTRYCAIGDQDFWLRIGVNYRLKHIPEFTGLQWLTSTSLSGKPAALAEIFIVQEKHRQHVLHRQSRQYTSGELHLALNRFLDTITILVENGLNKEALHLYTTHRDLFPPMQELQQFDGLMAQLRIKSLQLQTT